MKASVILENACNLMKVAEELEEIMLSMDEQQNHLLNGHILQKGENVPESLAEIVKNLKRKSQGLAVYATSNNNGVRK